ncbi:hypothetical protein TRIP_B350106 [uncultured Desulfatiglans sp.]|uniref:Uncharacterized protein n=1 Tax=Uncultured Desulfatiglans sp. TaxID=1748965 RepID=A0A653AAB2_UNCDX|nr:hypothetical protein TRIP_B350106 [uncultured Desulfatiglans sp.]
MIISLGGCGVPQPPERLISYRARQGYPDFPVDGDSKPKDLFVSTSPFSPKSKEADMRGGKRNQGKRD